MVVMGFIGNVVLRMKMKSLLISISSIDIKKRIHTLYVLKTKLFLLYRLYLLK